MLFISIPKSAATAFTESCAQAHGFRKSTAVRTRGTAPEGFIELALIHGSCREFDDHLLNVFTPDTVHHLHIPPTEKNKKIPAGVPKVVVLRDPGEVVDAYFCEIKKGFRSLPTSFNGVKTLNEFKLRANQIGLLDELRRFYHGWACESENISIINYAEIIAGGGGVRECCERFDLAEPKKFELVYSYNFTGSRPLVESISHFIRFRLDSVKRVLRAGVKVFK